MKKFEFDPKIEIIHFREADIVTTSGLFDDVEAPVWSIK